MIKWYKEVKDDFLTLDNWNIIKEIYTFLKPFYKITLMSWTLIAYTTGCVD